MEQPGELLAQGRDSDIFACGKGLVLRRSREGKSMAVEARTMEYARQHEFPVPAVHDLSADGTDLVMERVEGPTMLATIGTRPWTLRHQGAVLAALHERLHRVAAPEWVPDAPSGRGDRLIHLDLHPLNVMLTADGPVVIDWPNAARGDGNTDIALTWVLMAAGGIASGRIKAAVQGRGRSILIRSLLRPFDVATVRSQLREVVEWKVRDPHMSAQERDAMWRLVDPGA